GALGLGVVMGVTGYPLGFAPITAQAERAIALWPNAGEPDARPPLGAPYTRLEPVAPRAPAVPATAPAALRLYGISQRPGMS
ncbi:hypothetical protein AB0K48_52485, partial [Nonomuraea sp. NPDC055795]